MNPRYRAMLYKMTIGPMSKVQGPRSLTLDVGLWALAGGYLTLSMYRASLGLTRIFSPSTTKGGTDTVTPFSSVAGLLEFEAVAPLSGGSVRVTVRSIVAGSVTPIGWPL